MVTFINKIGNYIEEHEKIIKKLQNEGLWLEW